MAVYFILKCHSDCDSAHEYMEGYTWMHKHSCGQITSRVLGVTFGTEHDKISYDPQDFGAAAFELHHKLVLLH